jgi:hypothetical protein
VLCAWRLGQRPESAPAAFLVSRSADRLLRVSTRAGFSLSATSDHPFYTPQGMRPLENLLPRDRVAVHPFEGVPYEPPEGQVILDESAFACVVARLGKGESTSDLLKAKGLLPLKDDHPSLPALLRVMGYLFGDGTTYLSRGKGYAVFYGDPEGLEEARRDLSRLGFRAGGVYRRLRTHTFRGWSFTTEECSLKVSSTCFVLLMYALGLPLGNRAKQDYGLPGWLHELTRCQQANFLAGLFGLASAFVDVRASFAPFVVRHRVALRRAVLGVMALWFAWTLTELPPLDEPNSEGGSHGLVAALAAVGAVAYALAAARYWYVYRGRLGLLQASVIACFVLLAQAMVGVVLTGERAWHASWWEWHVLMLVAFGAIAVAAGARIPRSASATSTSTTPPPARAR